MESFALRAVYPVVNNLGTEEALLDSGSQIVSMARDIAVEFGLTWNPDIVINMESAQGHIEPTLGLARDHLSSWAEARALKNESAEAIGRWLFEDIICRWGCLIEIITDNGPPFLKAVKWLEQKYGITGIKISAYNSRANGSVERPHWDI